MERRTRLFVAATLDPLFEGLCGGVRLVQRHGLTFVVLEPVAGLEDLPRVWARAGPPEQGLAVLPPPSFSPPTEVAGPLRRDVEELIERAPGLTVVQFLAAPDPEAEAVLLGLGVHSTILPRGGYTAGDLAVRLQALLSAPLTAELLEGFPKWVPSWLALVLGRFAEELGGSPLRGPDDLAVECGWDPTELTHAMGRRGLGRLETWMDRIRIYAVLRRGGEEGALQDEAFRFSGFPSFEAFERTCAGLGVPSASVFDGPDGRRHALELLFGTLSTDELAKGQHRGADKSDPPTRGLPRPIPSGLRRQLEQFREVAIRAARSILADPADADAVATQVLANLWQRFADREAWDEVSEAYVWVAARNAAKDVLRRRARRPEWIEFDEHRLVDGKPPPPRTVQDQEFREILRQGCMELSPSQRTAVWLCDAMEWPVQDVAACMDRTSASIRNLKARGRTKLQEVLVDRATGRPGDRATGRPGDRATERPSGRSSATPASAMDEAPGGPDGTSGGRFARV